MPTGTYAPWPHWTGFTNTGAIAATYKLFTYLSGTSTKTDTYTNVGLSAANTNPIVLDSAGRATIFLDPAVAYKFVLATPTASDPPAGGDIVWTRDSLLPVPPYTSDVDIAGTAGENLTANDCVYISTGAGNDAARTAGRWYKADQTFSNRSAAAVIVGFATATVSAAASTTIRTGGRITGLGGLTPGANYCIDTTPGAIAVLATSAGQRTIGRADSTTTLVLTYPAQLINSATQHTDGTYVSGVVTNDAQSWQGLKTFVTGMSDTAHNVFLAGNATNNTTTFSNLGLSVSVVSGAKYVFELVLQMANSTAADGMKVDFDGGAATMTDFRCGSILTRETGAVVTLANGVSTALATDINVAAMASTSQHTLRITGSLEPSSSDTFIPRMAMNAVTAGTLTVYRGSYLALLRTA